MFLLLVFFSLNPILGHACSCYNEFPNRFETLSYGIERGEVYSAVVIGATCTCVADDIHYCLTYSYSESSASYTAEVIAKFYVDAIYNSDFLKTCVEAENNLAPDVTRVSLKTRQRPDVVENGTSVFVCPFNDPENPEYALGADVCMYMIRVTEVFIGNYSVGDVILSIGPDTLSSCANSNYGAILELNAEYLVGVGGPCQAFNDWQLLSAYTEDDLEDLRELAERANGGDGQTSSITVLTAVLVVMVGLLASL